MKSTNTLSHEARLKRHQEHMDGVRRVRRQSRDASRRGQDT